MPAGGTKYLNSLRTAASRRALAISKVTKGFGRYQDGEDVIVCTYQNADKAVQAILKRLKN